MENKIEQTLEYYQLVLDRLTAGGSSPHQVAEYEKVIALVRECTTKEEIESGMKAQGLDTSIGNALVIDKIYAHYKAAMDSGQKEIADVYHHYSEKMVAEPTMAYVLSSEYPEKLKEFFDKNSTILGIILEIFSAWFGLKYTHEVAKTDRTNFLQQMKKASFKLTSLGTDLESVLQEPYFREHLPLSGKQMDTFLLEVKANLTPTDQDNSQIEEWSALTQSALEELKDKKDDLKKLLDEQESRQKRVLFSAVAVGEQEADYLFEKIWQQDHL